MKRLVVVSNRVPVPKRNRPPEGGLATAVLSALEGRGGLWFGWSGDVSSGKRDLERSRYNDVRFATLPLTRPDYEEYYKGYSNRVLWPLFHARLDRMEFRRSFEEGYRRVNQLFAERLAPLLRSDDVIWIHDYHLIPLARRLREMRCHQPMGFFLHVPFPPHDLFRSLPRYRSVLRDFLAYDLVGFQTELDRRSFLESVRLGLRGAKVTQSRVSMGGDRVHAGVFPISVDVDDTAERARKGREAVQGRRLLTSLAGRALVVGVDRLDYSKGLTQRFRAFEMLLRRHPDVRGRVVLLQIAQPSRGDVPEYRAMRRTLNLTAGEINGRFAEYDWVPIRYLNKGFARTTILGFLSIATIGLVTPLRDGMNLVAKEFVAAQLPHDPGVLVLSELAGAARELHRALLVNPHDVDEMAEALQRGLGMKRNERIERWRSMIRVLRRQDIHRWRRRFLESLDEASAGARLSPRAANVGEAPSPRR